MQCKRSKEYRQFIIEHYEKLPMLIYKKMAKTKEEKQLLEGVKLELRDEVISLYHAQQILDEDSTVSFAEGS